MSRGRDVRNDVGAASDGALAGLAVPDAGGVAADGGLAAEGAGVLGVLRNLHLLDLLTQGGTVAVKGTDVSLSQLQFCARRLHRSSLSISRSVSTGLRLNGSKKGGNGGRHFDSGWPCNSSSSASLRAAKIVSGSRVERDASRGRVRGRKFDDLPSTVLAAAQDVSKGFQNEVSTLLYVRHADLLRALGHLG